jgi:hypothetical protein
LCLPSFPAPETHHVDIGEGLSQRAGQRTLALEREEELRPRTTTVASSWAMA